MIMIMIPFYSFFSAFHSLSCVFRVSACAYERRANPDQLLLSCNAILKMIRSRSLQERHLSMLHTHVQTSSKENSVIRSFLGAMNNSFTSSGFRQLLS